MAEPRRQIALQVLATLLAGIGAWVLLVDGVGSLASGFPDGEPKDTFFDRSLVETPGFAFAEAHCHGRFHYVVGFSNPMDVSGPHVPDDCPNTLRSGAGR